MKESNPILPPAWAERFLTWYCRPEMLEDLQGDLNEYFYRNVKHKGVRKARWIYILDVLKFMRIYTLRTPKFINLFIQWIMIGSYIKTSGRSIVRNKLFSVINILGLAISMSVGLLMIGLLSDIFKYDKFNDHHGRIYRVISRYQYLENKDDHFMATTSLKAGKLIRETFAAPEEVAILRRGFDNDVSTEQKTVPLSGFWANESLFNVFSFDLVKGNKDAALKNPFSVVLTETSARKLFGSGEAIGKLVIIKDKSYTITGILRDIPKYSHVKFEMLGSLSTHEILSAEEIAANKDKSKNNRIRTEMNWADIWSTYVYLLLPPETDLKNLKTGLDQLSRTEDPTVKNTHIELDLQPMDDIMISENDLGNQIGPVMGSSTLWIFGSLAFVVVLSAGVNYTNLSIARSLRRTREVGIRKVIGALKGHVIGQFVVEAILISLAALVMAFFLFLVLKPYFLGIKPGFHKLLDLDLSAPVIIYFILFSIVVGTAAGLFPALFFSRINAVQVLKTNVPLGGFKKLTLRKVLIVFQYSISIIFITSTLIVYREYKHFVAFDLGFKTTNILNIELQGNQAAGLKKELSELPEVTRISQSLLVTSVGNYWTTRMKYYANPDDSTGVNYNVIDENYIPLHGHQLLAGRNFTAQADSSKESEVIVNEQVLKRFKIADENPVKALDEIVKVDGNDLRIVGVMRDFQYGRANDQHEAREVIFRYSPRNANLLNVEIQSTDLVSTYEKIESLWKKFDTIHPLQAHFYDEQIEKAFDGLNAAVKVAGFLAFLAICIASMGLLGMVVFTTETRVKEISIRKVLGATESGLIYNLGKGFILLLAIAAVVALPVTYLFFDQVVFQELANHAPIEGIDLVTGVLAAIVVALIMIVSQTLKVARTNPAEVLKSE